MRELRQHMGVALDDTLTSLPGFHRVLEPRAISRCALLLGWSCFQNQKALQISTSCTLQIPESVGGRLLYEPSLAQQIDSDSDLPDAPYWGWVLQFGKTHMALPSHTGGTGSLFSETKGMEGHVWVCNHIKMKSRHSHSSNCPHTVHTVETSQRSAMVKPPQET